MKLSTQIQGYLSELAEKTGKGEKELIQIAVFNLFNDKNNFVISPNTGEMWVKDEIPSSDDVVEITDSAGKSFFWVQFPDTDQSRKLVGIRIRQLREDAGLTQDQLAEKTGLLKQNISRIESGKYSTGQDILSKIATALGKKLDIV